MVTGREQSAICSSSSLRDSSERSWDSLEIVIFSASSSVMVRFCSRQSRRASWEFLMSCLRKYISKPPSLIDPPLVEELSRNQEQLHHGLFKRQCLMGQNRHKDLILPKGRTCAGVGTLRLSTYLAQADGIVECLSPAVEVHGLLDVLLTLILACQEKEAPSPPATPSWCLLGERQALLPGCLQVLRIVVVGGAQVDPVMSLGCFDGFLPLVGGLVELVQEVISFAILVQLLCVLLGGEGHPKSPSAPTTLHFLSPSNFSESDINPSQPGCGIYQHAQLDGQHSHPGLLLWLLLSLPQCLGSSCMTHVPQANFGNIEPLSLHTHASHVLPDSLTAGNRKEKESCYCVTWKANQPQPQPRDDSTTALVGTHLQHQASFASPQKCGQMDVGLFVSTRQCYSRVVFVKPEELCQAQLRRSITPGSATRLRVVPTRMPVLLPVLPRQLKGTAKSV
ncbi:hypothetical protein DV515_00013282 [Chloebia gouldiae]|uniref:Uncharacterized protein n=1 Tax=Chloebia gouldiae TaxID=44316 RepID=A0A3L8S2E5_CHLGU|nr:hypothetical protein DV515_00013282 [Chloebia gouldiae]